jgi:hypothetical protein
MHRVGEEVSLQLPASTDVDAWLTAAHGVGAKIVQVSPRHETLEDLFLREIAAADDSPEAREGRT